MTNNVKSRRTTLGSVQNRRSTMAPSNHTINNKKRQTRKSMAPRIAGSDQNAKTMTPNRRKSTGGDRNHPRTTRISLAPVTSIANTIKSDPRPISDKKYVNTCIRKLHNYLTIKGYENTPRLKDLTRPSAKDFHNFVTFLLTRIDPIFPNSNRKIEDEISSAFKGLGYPFNISKTALVAAGSPHTWPTLLLALTWLIELLECTEEEDYNEEVLWDGIESAGKPGQPLCSLEELEHRTENAFLKYVEHSYEFFLSGDDVQTETLEEELLMYLEKDNMVIEGEIEAVTDKNAVLVESISEFEKEILDLPERQIRREELATDIEKFHELVRQLNEQKAARTQKVAIQTKELKQKNEWLKTKEQSVKGLQQKVETQELSMHDVQKLEGDHAILENKIEQITRVKRGYDETALLRYTELKKSLAKLEALSSAGYNSIMHKLGLEDLEGRNSIINLQAEQVHEEEQSKMLGGVVLKTDIIPHLSNLKDEYIQKSFGLRIEMLDYNNKLGSSQEAVNEITDGINVLEVQRKRSNERLERGKKENESVHTTKLQEVKLVQEKINALQDPVNLEATITKCQKQCTELEALRQKHQDENIAHKQAVLMEINNALYACAEYKEYQEKIPKEVEGYIFNTKLSKVNLSTNDEHNLYSN